MGRALLTAAQAAIVAISFSATAAFANVDTAKVLSKHRVYAPDSKTLKSLAEKFEITNREGSAYDVIVPQDSAGVLKQVAPRSELVEADISAAVTKTLRTFQPMRPGKGFGLPSLGEFFPQRTLEQGPRYHSFDEVLQWMRGHMDRQPGMVSVEQYGTSGEGRPLFAMKVTGKGGDEKTKPLIMLTAATHGDELITVEVLMSLVDKLLEGYGSDQRATEILNRRVVWIVPVVNPDGFVSHNRYDGDADPNRSYPYPGRENARPTASIQALMDFFNARDFKGSIDFHAHGGLIMYPWGYTTQSPNPSGFSFQNVAARMAATNGYRAGQISRILYTAPGSSADYWFWKKGTLSLGIELGRSKVPNPREFASYVTSQLESTWLFLENF